MKDRIGLVNNIISGKIPRAEADVLMKQFPWLSAAVESHKNLAISSPSPVEASDGIDEEIDRTEKPKRRGK